MKTYKHFKTARNIGGHTPVPVRLDSQKRMRWVLDFPELLPDGLRECTFHPILGGEVAVKFPRIFKIGKADEEHTVIATCMYGEFPDLYELFSDPLNADRRYLEITDKYRADRVRWAESDTHATASV